MHPQSPDMHSRAHNTRIGVSSITIMYRALPLVRLTLFGWDPTLTYFCGNILTLSFACHPIISISS